MIEEITVLFNRTESGLKAIRNQATLYFENSPGRKEILHQIEALEAKLVKVDEICKEVDNS